MLCSVDVAVIIFGISISSILVLFFILHEEKRHGDDQVRLHQYASSDIHQIVQRQLGVLLPTSSHPLDAHTRFPQHTGQRVTCGPTDFLEGGDDDDAAVLGLKRKACSPDPRVSPIPTPNTQPKLDPVLSDSPSPHPFKRPRPTITHPADNPSSIPTPSSSTQSGTFRLVSSPPSLHPAEHDPPTRYAPKTYVQSPPSVSSGAYNRSVLLHPQPPTPAPDPFVVICNPRTDTNTSTSASPTRSLSSGGGGSLAFEYPVHHHHQQHQHPSPQRMTRPASTLGSPASSSPGAVRGTARRSDAIVENNEWFELLCGEPPTG